MHVVCMHTHHTNELAAHATKPNTLTILLLLPPLLLITTITTTTTITTIILLLPPLPGQGTIRYPGACGELSRGGGGWWWVQWGGARSRHRRAAGREGPSESDYQWYGGWVGNGWVGVGWVLGGNGC